MWSVELLVFGPGAVLFALSSAVASGLSDEVSDIKGGKRTFVTMFGNGTARSTIYLLPIFGALAWYVAWALQYGFRSAWLIAPLVGFVAWRNRALRELGYHAVTNAFDAQNRFKRELHRTIWISNLAMAALFIVQAINR